MGKRSDGFVATAVCAGLYHWLMLGSISGAAAQFLWENAATVPSVKK